MEFTAELVGSIGCQAITGDFAAAAKRANESSLLLPGGLQWIDPRHICAAGIFHREAGFG